LMLGMDVTLSAKQRRVRAREYMSLGIWFHSEWKKVGSGAFILNRFSGLSSTSLGSPSLHVERRQSKVARLTN
jgi:hypothetical protein